MSGIKADKVFLKSINRQIKEKLLFITEDGKLIEIRDYEHDVSLNLDDVEISSYTGANDKDGKCIYEFDIIEHISKDGTSHRGVIRFGQYIDVGEYYISKTKDKTTNMFFYVSSKIKLFLDYSKFRNVKVIGNIFENPELLVEGNKMDESIIRCNKINELLKEISSYDRHFFMNGKTKEVSKFYLDKKNIYFIDARSNKKIKINLNSENPARLIEHGSTLRNMLLHFTFFIKGEIKKVCLKNYINHFGYEKDSIKKILNKGEELCVF